MKKASNEILELKTTVSTIKNSLDGLYKLEIARERFNGLKDRSKRFNTKSDSQNANRGHLKSRSHERSQTQESIYIYTI